MAGERIVQCIGPSYWLADRKTAIQRSINLWMMGVEGLGEDAQVVLESAPGLELAHDFGATVRGMRNADGRLFVAAGSTLYEVRADGVVIGRGSLSSSSGWVSMANGTGQLAMTSGATADVFNLDTNALSAIVSAGWRGSNRVEFIDGYFVFVAPDTEQFYISGIDNAASLDALDFSSADSQPDNIVAQIVARRELYLMGSRSTEVWINSGGADFPFARYQGTPIDVGVVGPRAVCAAADSIVWVGQTLRGGPYVYTLNGYQPVRISTQAVEQQLQRSTDLTQARVWAYQEAGAEFVAVDAPGLETTWVWDAATKQWHERGELVAGEWSPSRIEFGAYFNGAHYVAGGTKLYRMSRDFHDLAGDALVRERTWPHLVNPSLEPLTFRSLELRCTTGGETAGTVTLEVSNDGGSVFGAPLARSLGAVGQRAQRVRWMPLGTCPAGGSRVYRIRCADAVPLTIQGATIS